MNREKVQDVRQFLAKRVIGQPDLIDGLMLALLADGHIIVEGPPGLAKTRAIKELAKCVEGSFHRVQFTPDLLPADITGTDIYHPEDGSFVFQPGPIFHHLLLADEINRAPAKVQSALLEAMAEHQITIGRKTYRLPDLFLVMATQNPIEQEGTYPLPEAQLDRFMLHIKIDYPDAQSELFSARNEVSRIEISDSLEQYIVSIVMTTRNPQVYDSDLGRWLSYGVSSRASIALARCAKARAWLSSRNYVTPDDIQICAYPVLRHRLVLSMEAEADNVTPTDVIEKILKLVAVS